MASERPEAILLVDDEFALRTVIGAMLHRAGYEVLLAGSGAEALTLFDAHAGAIRILVSDIAMPHMQGPGLAQRLIALKPELFVLLVSGYAKCSPPTLGLRARNI